MENILNELDTSYLDSLADALRENNLSISVSLFEAKTNW
tara:strand:- start:5284 stop:5400 length:117 start_codon:yes stop_codon:yes gene_type:complete